MKHQNLKGLIIMRNWGSSRLSLLFCWVFCLLLPGTLARGADGPVSPDLITEITPEITPEPLPPIRPSFDGAWQKDFSRSDKWDDELERILDQMRRDAQRGQSSARVPSGYVIQRRRGSANIIELAQLAEYISRQTIIRVRQTAVEVRIQREGDADLVCSTLPGTTQTFTSEYGNEICGWDAQQLIYHISLAGGVDILHRFTVSENREELSMATSISSGGTAFNLIQFFWRYDSPNENYSCIETISRGNSCSLTDFQRGR